MNARSNCRILFALAAVVVGLSLVLGCASTSPALLPVVQADAATPEDKGWEFRIEAGAAATGGNSVARDFDARIDAVRKWEKDEVSAFARAEWGEAKIDGETKRNRNRQTAGAEYKRMLRGTLYAFANEGLERDEFKDIRLRSETFVGLGATLLKDDKHELSAQAGPGFVVTDFRSADDDSSLSGQLSENWQWKINQAWIFVQAFELVSNLGEIDDDFRTITTADLRTDLTESLYLSFGIEHRYDAEPARDNGERAERQDYKFMLKLGFSF